MGFLDRLLGRPSREQFADQQTWSIGDPAFAAWLFGAEGDNIEPVTAYTVLGLSAVLRAVSLISTTIASLPLKTYERQGDDRARIPSVFDDPYPGIDGMTPFAWVETVLIHLLLWREAYLWHDSIDSQSGQITAYRPVIPSAFAPVRRSAGKRIFTYTDPATGQRQEVGSEQVTYIPGPSLDGFSGHPLLRSARAVFSAAISGDKTAQRILGRGIRIAGLVTPRDGEEDFDEAEGAAIQNQLRQTMVGSLNAGDIALVNRKLDLQKWTATNIEAQWDETRMHVLMEIEQLFGVPPHLMADTVKQTSWGTGVAEQNAGLARFTLRGWSDRLEQALGRRLEAAQFLEFDYKGLLQGTPAEEGQLLLAYKGAGVMTDDEVRKVLNLPPLTPEQRAQISQLATPPPTPFPPRVRNEVAA